MTLQMAKAVVVAAQECECLTTADTLVMQLAEAERRLLGN
jgi:hypothetical protein